MVPGVNFANSTDGEHSRWVVGTSDGEFSLTWTGNSLIARLALPSRPARYSLRQPNTWLALTPCDSATRERCTFDQGLFDDPPLLLDCAVLPLGSGSALAFHC